jgi:hypothetical protein
MLMSIKVKIRKGKKLRRGSYRVRANKIKDGYKVGLRKSKVVTRLELRK